MVVFEPLSVEEANEFLDESIRDFLTERLPAGHVAPADLARMRAELRTRLLPEGTGTSGHHFEAILKDGERVGRVWFGSLMDDATAIYVCDLTIAPERRREGHARAAVALIIQHATHSHFTRVGLTVAHANTAAVALYESLGFVTTSSDDTEREMWLTVG